MEKNIYLIGFMGSGKTALGRRLAAQMGRSFLDLDAEVEASSGMAIPAIFSRYGEARFRAMEETALATVARQSGYIVALGGGTPVRDRIWPVLRRSGRTVYLKRSAAQLLQNLQRSEVDRPLLAGIAPAEQMRYIEQLLAEREPFYTRADFILDCADGWTIAETLTHLIALLEENA